MSWVAGEGGVVGVGATLAARRELANNTAGARPDINWPVQSNYASHTSVFSSC
jgi:hypothetical protein